MRRIFVPVDPTSTDGSRPAPTAPGNRGRRRGRLDAGWRSALALAASVALAALVSSVSGAEAGQSGEAFTVSPAEGAPFAVIEVSGGGCTEGPAPSVSGLVFRPDAGGVVAFVATPDAEGDWATTFTVPPNVPTGDYDVTALCTTDPDQVDGVAYAPQPFTILAGEEATQTVSPLRAVAGRAVTVSVSGDLCRGEDASVRVGISAHPSEEADEFVAQATFAPDADGDWAGELVLDADLAPGTYRVGTTCNLRLSSFLYEIVDIVLTAGATPPAPPATPVAGQPRFTG